MQLEFWQQVLIYIIGALLLLWLTISIYQGIRYKILQVLSFILITLAIVFSIGEYPASTYLEEIGFAFSVIAIVYVLLGILMAKRRWINRRGTKDLTKFRNLMIYAYIRHPVTWGTILASIAIVFINHSILSNALSLIGAILLTLSSFEKDLYLASLFGYQYRVYIETVPRFSLLFSLYIRLKKRIRRK